MCVFFHSTFHISNFLQIVRQVLSTTERGDSIELGLLVSPILGSSDPKQSSNEGLGVPPSNRIRVIFRISHRFTPTEAPENANASPANEIRPKPSFSTLLLRRILRHLGGYLTSDLSPPELFSSGRTCDLELSLDCAKSLPPTPVEVTGQDQPTEPTLEELTSFGETLKGKRVTLYANAKGSFAHHLTSYLTAWGLGVTHVSPDGQVDHPTEQSPTNSSTPDFGSSNQESRPSVPELIFIDDDVDILKDRLQGLRFEPPHYPFVINPKKRPSLSSNHRPRSSPQVARTLRQTTPVIILLFTSLSNFKLIKDVIQSFMVSITAAATPLPEIMIIPKPAGPRRFLTALYTAIMKPTVDPFFTPIATSPLSPGGNPPQLVTNSTIGPPVNEGAAGQTSVPLSQSQTFLSKHQNRPPHTSRTNSDRSIKSLDCPAGLPSGLPPSPLALSDNVEYFSAAAQQLGSSPSSGLVVQSPDGQTAGIYFHPKIKHSSRNPSSSSVERAKGLSGMSGSRRQSTPHMSSNSNIEDVMTFSSLYQAPQKPTSLPEQSVVSLEVSTVNIHSPTPPPVSNSPTIVPSPAKIITASPSTEGLQRPQPQTPSPSSRSPVASRAGDDTRKLASPVLRGEGLSGSPSRRNFLNKSSVENKDAAPSIPAKPAGKMSASGDANVVPPISVLIVDGMYLSRPFHCVGN